MSCLAFSEVLDEVHYAAGVAPLVVLGFGTCTAVNSAGQVLILVTVSSSAHNRASGLVAY